MWFIQFLTCEILKDDLFLLCVGNDGLCKTQHPVYRFSHWETQLALERPEHGPLTFDLQFAGNNGFSVGIYGLAGVHAAVKGAGFADLQRADALHADLPELGVVANDHLVLHPLNLGLLEKLQFIGDL